MFCERFDQMVFIRDEQVDIYGWKPALNWWKSQSKNPANQTICLKTPFTHTKTGMSWLRAVGGFWDKNADPFLKLMS